MQTPKQNTPEVGERNYNPMQSARALSDAGMDNTLAQTLAEQIADAHNKGRREFLDGFARVEQRFGEAQKESDLRFEKTQKESELRFEKAQEKSELRFEKRQEEFGLRFEKALKESEQRLEIMIDSKINNVRAEFRGAFLKFILANVTIFGVVLTIFGVILTL